MTSKTRILVIRIVVALVLLVAVGGLLISSINRISMNDSMRDHTDQVLDQLNSVFSTLQDAETGQRGYLLTGDPTYLAPYNSATATLNKELKLLSDLAANSSLQQERLKALQPIIDSKMAELQQTIDLRQSQGLDAALQVVLTSQGKADMDQIRSILSEMQATENSLLEARTQATQHAIDLALLAAGVGSLVSIALLSIALISLSREFNNRLKTEIALRESRNTLETRVRERTAQLESVNRQRTFIAEASRLLVSTLEYENTLQAVAELVVTQFADYCLIEIDDIYQKTPYLAIAHSDPVKTEAVRALWNMSATTASSAIQPELRKPFLNAAPGISRPKSVAPDGPILRFFQSLNASEVLTTPLLANDNAMGTIAFLRTSETPFTAEDLDLADDLARRIALAVENAQLYRTARQARKIAEQNAARIARYQRVTSALSEVLSPVEVLKVIVNQGISSIGAVGGLIITVTDGGSLKVTASIDFDERLIDRWQQLSVSGSTLPADGIRMNQPIWISSVDEAKTRYPILAEHDLTHQAWAAVPLANGGKVTGIMILAFSYAQLFGDNDRAFIVTLVQKCSQALERARLYNDVREQREQLQVTLSSIGDAVIATDAHGQINFINKVAQTITGWLNDDAIGVPLPDVFKIINETSRTTVESPYDIVIREKGAVGLANHTLLITRDGQEIPIDDSGAPIFDDEGNIRGIVLVFRDIQTRRAAERQLDNTFQRTMDLYKTSRQIGIASSAAAILDALLSSQYLQDCTSQAAILVFDRAWHETRPARCTAAATFGEALLPGFSENFAFDDSPLIESFSGGKSFFIEDLALDLSLASEVKTQLTEQNVSSLIGFSLSASGAFFGLLILYANRYHWTEEDFQHSRIFADQVAIVMDNVRLFEAERHARTEAENANAIKLKFLAMVSHELRTPLTSISGFATSLLATDVTWTAEQQHEFITIISSEADKLTDLISQLLDLSQLQAGMMRIRPGVRSLAKIIEAAMVQLTTLTPNHQLVMQIPSDLPPVMVDDSRIAEVITNLVDNAAKYSPSGTTITVSAAISEHMIKVDVSDQGPGIPLDSRDLIFEAFQQLRYMSPQTMKGAGLGLAICKGLIEAHHGRIWIADQALPGTTISFTVPIVNT